MNLVLTFNASPKANSNASTHTNYLITLLKNDPDDSVEQTHNYTGEAGPLNSPRVPVCHDFRGLAKGHRSLSERGIIAGKPARSTPYFLSCEADPGPAAILPAPPPSNGPKLSEIQWLCRPSGPSHRCLAAVRAPDSRSPPLLFRLPLLVMR